MDFWTEIPSLGRNDLRDLKKGIDASFRSFSRAYGPEIEAFFDPLYFFFSETRETFNCSALANNTCRSWSTGIPWFKELEACSRFCLILHNYRLFWHVERYDGYNISNFCCNCYLYSNRNSNRDFNVTL